MGVQEMAAGLVAEAKRLPWWAWLLIAAGLYLGYRLITGGGAASSDSSADPLAGVLDTTGPSGADSSADSSSGDPLPTLTGNPPIDYDDPGDTGNPGDAGITATPARVIQQGYDIHQASADRAVQSAAANAAQASRSRTQVQDLRSSPAAQATPAQVASASHYVNPPSSAAQHSGDIHAASRPPAPPPTMRGRDVGVGGGPDAHHNTHQANAEPVYTMRAGEDLYSVADRLGVSSDDLYAANRDRIDASVREAGLAGMGIYALPAIGDGLELIIPAAIL